MRVYPFASLMVVYFVKGASVASVHSNAVVVEKPLPAGWFRFRSDVNDRFYYVNIRRQCSQWTRPEEDPYFLEESVAKHFQEFEIDHLRSLFDEEIAHFSSVSADRMRDVLRECGERLYMRRILQLFRVRFMCIYVMLYERCN